ncbi:hypothetical protein ABPG75_006024 [Micractinium tetrahymenae]
MAGPAKRQRQAAPSSAAEQPAVAATAGATVGAAAAAAASSPPLHLPPDIISHLLKLAPFNDLAGLLGGSALRSADLSFTGDDCGGVNMAVAAQHLPGGGSGGGAGAGSSGLEHLTLRIYGSDRTRSTQPRPQLAVWDHTTWAVKNQASGLKLPLQLNASLERLQLGSNATAGRMSPLRWNKTVTIAAPGALHPWQHASNMPVWRMLPALRELALCMPPIAGRSQRPVEQAKDGWRRRMNPAAWERQFEVQHQLHADPWQEVPAEGHWLVFRRVKD